MTSTHAKDLKKLTTPVPISIDAMGKVVQREGGCTVFLCGGGGRTIFRGGRRRRRRSTIFFNHYLLIACNCIHWEVPTSLLSSLSLALISIHGFLRAHFLGSDVFIFPFNKSRPPP